MSKTAQTFELGDFNLRDETDEVIVCSSYNSTPRLHIPAEETGTRALCKWADGAASLNRKSIDCYPDGYFDWCRHCLAERGVIE